MAPGCCTPEICSALGSYVSPWQREGVKPGVEQLSDSQLVVTEEQACWERGTCPCLQGSAGQDPICRHLSSLAKTVNRAACAKARLMHSPSLWPWLSSSPGDCNPCPLTLACLLRAGPRCLTSATRACVYKQSRLTLQSFFHTHVVSLLSRTLHSCCWQGPDNRPAILYHTAKWYH